LNVPINMIYVCKRRSTFSFYPTLTGSKTPTSRFEISKEDKWEITARKDPISLANHQWGMKKTPTDGSLTL
jgi:hypothetical protein